MIRLSCDMAPEIWTALSGPLLVTPGARFAMAFGFLPSGRSSTWRFWKFACTSVVSRTAGALAVTVIDSVTARDLQVDVDTSRTGDRDSRGTGDFLKTFQRNAHGVVARRERRQVVVAVRVRDGGARALKLRRRRGDGCTRKRSTVRSHRTGQITGNGALCERADACEQEHRNDCEKARKPHQILLWFWWAGHRSRTNCRISPNSPIWASLSSGATYITQSISKKSAAVRRFEDRRPVC